MRRVTATTLALVLFGPAAPAAWAATLEVRASASATPHVQDPISSNETGGLQNARPTALISRFASASGGSGGGAAAMSVGPGYFAGSVSANVNFTAPGAGGIFDDEVTRANASVFGSYRDEVTIAHPGLTRQTGTLTATVIISGSMATSGGTTSASSAWNFFKSFNPSSLPSTSESATGNVFQSIQLGDGSLLTGSLNPGGDVVTIEAPFVFGEPSSIFAQFSIGATAGGAVRDDAGAGVAGVSAMFGNTVRWEGIDQIFGPDGEPVEGFSVSSASGMDWSGPTLVPVPAALPLMATGLLGLAWYRRRQQRR